MKVKLSGIAVGLLLAGQAVAAPLVFGWMDNNDTRREKFQKHFLVGDALSSFEVGKRKITLPEGNWVIREVNTDTNAVREQEEDYAHIATGMLWLEDRKSGEGIVIRTRLSPSTTSTYLSQLDDACLGAVSADLAFSVYRQQIDGGKSERQSCVRVSGEVIADKNNGTTYLQLQARVMESRNSDYLLYAHYSYLPLAAGQTAASMANSQPVQDFVKRQMAWGVGLKKQIAGQMAW